MMDSSNNSTGGDSGSLLSFENGGDLIVLPPKKKKVFKPKNQVPAKPKLSKSQKRKLKKLEEDKEKEKLLSESIKSLEKHKIPDDVYSLMFSSRNLGQVETVCEKRRREVQFSKAGLELPHIDKPNKKKKNDIACQSPEVQRNSTQPQAVNDYGDSRSSLTEVVMGEGSISDSENMISRNADITFPRDDVQLAEEMTSETIQPFAELPKKSTDSVNQEIMQSIKKVDRDQESEDIGESNRNYSSVTNSDPPTVVHVSRPKEVEKQRKDLPIVMMEQEIMEAINENTNVILCGETGCGKTTQVPQFLYEAGFGSNDLKTRGGIIGVTQPRRVAVLATAKRVAFELGVRLGKEVGFQVRHDRRIGDKCSIKFMTDGILLREVQSDFLLKRYSVIILDEAHERSLNTDILVGMLSRVIQQRQMVYEEQQKRILSGETIECHSRIYPLKLVLMSATLRVEDFVSGGRIFRDPPPVIEVPTRQYPVTTHFSKKTDEVDYVGQAYKKVVSIHKRLPPGGILVFVTGQREVEYLCKRLRRASQEIVNSAAKRNNEASAIPEENLKANDMEEISEACEFQGTSGNDITDRFSSYSEEDQFNFLENELETSYDSEEESDLEFYSDNEDQPKPSMESDVLGDDGILASLKVAFETLTDKKASGAGGKDGLISPEASVNPPNSIAKHGVKEEKGFNVGSMRVLPLYAMLPASAQLRVFDEIKDGERLVVVATNVAETSLTIPGVKYVVDTGREKVKNYNSSSGMESYEIQCISKASAAQRAGRAGRTGPGHCYRLYSSAVFCNYFPDFSVAEISKVPVDGVVLLLKSMNIGKVANFPFPTPPEKSALVEAERCLKVLEALDDEGRLTTLGKAMARYPMSPRHSRMLFTVIQIMQKVKGYDRANLVLGYAVAAAAALSLSNPFVIEYEGSESNDNADICKKVSDEEEKSRKKKVKQTVKVSRGRFSNPTSDALTIAFALQCFEISENRAVFCSENALHYKTMEEMSKLRKQLLQLVFSSSVSDLQQDFSWNHGTLDDVERVWGVTSDKHPLRLNEEEILGQAICAGWADRVAKRIRGPSILGEGEKKVNAARYQSCTLKETVFLHRWSSTSKLPPDFLVYSELLLTKRPYIQGATSVKPAWLLQYARPLCTFSAPVADRKPYYDPTSDEVLAWVSPTFGPHLWPLPLQGIPMKDDYSRAAVFACSLLEGHVLPCLKVVQQYLAEPPARILKPEGAGIKRVGNLLSKLSRRGRAIDNCAKLRKLWKEKPTELYNEIQAWFQKGFHTHFRSLWAEMQREVLLEPKERFAQRANKEKR